MNAVLFQKFSQKQMMIGLAVVMLLVMAASVMAGTGGTTEFGTVYTTVQGWFAGTLGKIIAIVFFGVGMCIGVVRQSILACVTGLACALAMAYGPDIIDSTITAALPILL